MKPTSSFSGAGRAVLLAVLSALPLHAQSNFAEWTGDFFSPGTGTAFGGFLDGTGSWEAGSTAAGTMPDFTWSVTPIDGPNDGLKNGADNLGAYTATSATHTNATITGTYGTLDNHLRIEDQSGDAFPSVTLTFAGFAPAGAWSFGFIGLNADNLIITAKGLGGTSIASSIVDGWFQSVYDAQPAGGLDPLSGLDGSFGTFLPSTVSGNGLPTLLAEGDSSSHNDAGTVAHYDGAYDQAGVENDALSAAGWFTPDTAVTSLTLTWENRNAQPATGESNPDQIQVWLAGTVPEPGSAMLLLIAAVALTRRRR